MDKISLGKKITIVSRQINMLRNKCLKDFGCKVGAAHLHAFVFFLNNPGCIEKQAVKALETDKTYIAKSVKKLVEQALITRETDTEDARYKRIWPTLEGENELQKMQKALEQITSIMSQNIDKADIEIFLHTLETMQNNILNSIEKG